ncbi:hypothetical protein OROGR_021253 [Orobanche gracilis]
MLLLRGWMMCAVFDEMPERDVFSWTIFVSAYAKNGEMSRACEVFGKMPVRNDVSWIVMISGFVSCRRLRTSDPPLPRFLREPLSHWGNVNVKCMFLEIKPNEAVLICALSACANLGSLDQRKWIHGHIDSNFTSESSNIITALIDMYTKCGRIDCAYRVFDKTRKRDVHNYTSMISGLSIHGLGEEAIRVFRRM